MASQLGILISSFDFLDPLSLTNDMEDVFVSKHGKMQPGILIGSFDCLHLLRLANIITWFGLRIYTPQLKELLMTNTDHALLSL